MIDEDKLWYKRGSLVTIIRQLGGGPVTLYGIILDTAVWFGREARYIHFISCAKKDADNAKHLIGKSEIIPMQQDSKVTGLLPSDMWIFGWTIEQLQKLLADNPVSLRVEGCIPQEQLIPEPELPERQV